MKKLIFLLLLFACDKAPVCYTCQTRTIKSYGSIISDNTTTFEKCDQTALQILEFENANTVKYVEPTMNDYGTIINVNVEKVCKCK